MWMVFETLYSVCNGCLLTDRSACVLPAAELGALLCPGLRSGVLRRIFQPCSSRVSAHVSEQPATIRAWSGTPWATEASKSAEVLSSNLGRYKVKHHARNGPSDAVGACCALQNVSMIWNALCLLWICMPYHNSCLKHTTRWTHCSAGRNPCIFPQTARFGVLSW